MRQRSGEARNQGQKGIFSLLIYFLVSLLPFLIQCPAFASNQPVVRPKIGLALGGGGARGAAHIGVLRVLERENIPIDYLVGTSAGALIASLYSAGINPDKLEDYVLSGFIKRVYKTDLSLTRGIFLYMNKLTKTFFRKPFYAGLYNDHKLHRFVDDIITKEDGSIELVIPLHVLAVDLVSGLPVVIKSGDVGLAVQASTAIPALRQPIPINDQLLVDGGVLKNIPVQEAKKMGADLVIAIDVDDKLELVKPQDFKSFEGVITRVINLGLKAQSEHVLDKADIVVSPDLSGVGILDLDEKSLLTAIKAGEEAAIEKLPDIKRMIELRSHEMKVASKTLKNKEEIKY